MNERIKLIRKEQRLNQDDFAAKLGLTKNFISLVETGGRVPSDRTISDICREFRVNEKWLRTGEGEMFVTQTRDEVIAEYLTKVAFGGETTAFQRSLISVMARMSVEEWQLLEAKARELLEEVQKETAGDEADC